MNFYLETPPLRNRLKLERLPFHFSGLKKRKKKRCLIRTYNELELAPALGTFMVQVFMAVRAARNGPQMINYQDLIDEGIYNRMPLLTDWLTPPERLFLETELVASVDPFMYGLPFMTL